MLSSDKSDDIGELANESELSQMRSACVYGKIQP